VTARGILNKFKLLKVEHPYEKWKKTTKLEELVYQKRLSRMFGIPLGMIVTIFIMAYFGFFEAMFSVMLVIQLWYMVIDIYYYKKYNLIEEHKIVLGGST